MLAEELKKWARDIKMAQDAKISGTIAETIRHEAKLAAQQGKFGLHIWLDTRKWSRQAAEQAAVELRKDGFEVKVDADITAWHSNTDWDEEEFISVSWA